MLRGFITFFIWGTFCFFSLAQEQTVYAQKVAEGEKLLSQKDYINSARAYSAAFQANAWRGYTDDRYHAARAWAMTGLKDSAFFNLYRITERANFEDLERTTREDDFRPLHSDTRWADLCQKIAANQPTMPTVRAQLLAILDEDQKYRLLIDSVQAQHGPDAPETQAVWRKMTQADQENLPKVIELLERYGWLGPREVGQGSMALFLVIQHSELPVQEKYLPMMREAVKNGKARGSELALLEDRVNMRNGRKQIYGSQIRMDAEGKPSIFPIEDPKNVDQRRAEMGLGPLAEYVGMWGIKWDADEIAKMEHKD
jgi:hypothetical protein